MKLEKVYIEKFRSIDSLNFNPNPQISTLVGANESGKSNILKAIQKINFDNDFSDEDKCRIYKLTDSFPMIALKFSLTDLELKHWLLYINQLPISSPVKDDFTLIISTINNIQITISCDQNYKKNYYFHFGDKGESTLGIKDPDLEKIKLYIFEKITPIQLYNNNSFSLLKKSVNMSELQKNPNKYPSYLDLFNIVGLDLDLLTDDEKNHEADGRLVELTDEFNSLFPQYWKQDSSVEFFFKIDRLNNFTVHIKDRNSKREYPESRSEGFQWYLSFIIKFLSESRKAENTPNIFMFDELGLHLHPTGQRDLITTINDVMRSNQILFSTHFPYLIDQNYPERVFVVTKEIYDPKLKKGGTEINSKPYEKIWSHVRSAIGLMLGDNLCTSSNMLVVEGPSEIFALRGLNNFFKNCNLENFDNDFISLFPGEGSGSGIPNGVNFCKILNLKVAALVDGDKAGTQLVGKLLSKRTLEKDDIFFLKDYIVYINKPEYEVTIEDLIPIPLYLNSINSFYKFKTNWKDITVNDFNKAANENPKFKFIDIIKKITKGIKDFGDFDKVGVIRQVFLDLEKQNSLEVYNKYKSDFDMSLTLITKIKKYYSINDSN